jgi:hypothetical protein
VYWEYKPSGERPFYSLVIVLGGLLFAALLLAFFTNNLSDGEDGDRWGFAAQTPHPTVALNYNQAPARNETSGQTVYSSLPLLRDSLYAQLGKEQAPAVLTAVAQQLTTPVVNK